MRTLILLSGGMDSATMLAFAKEGGAEVGVFSVYYQQRHGVELLAAKRIAQHYDLPLRIFELPKEDIFSGSSQTDASVPVPQGRYDEPSMKKTVVPNRNMILLAIAGAYAISHKYDRIAYAAHQGDHTIYPDCRPSFVAAMESALGLCDWHHLELWTPFLFLSKADIVKHGLRLKVPFELTWTCLAGETEVVTLNGARRIDTLRAGGWVWGYTKDGWTPARIERVYEQGVKPVYEVCVQDAIGQRTTFRATNDHRLMLRDGGYARVDELDAGASLMPSSIQLLRPGKTRRPYLAVKPHNDWQEPTEYLHRIVARFKGLDLSGDTVAHHLDNNSLNNLPDNLDAMSRGQHSRLACDQMNSPEANKKKSVAVATTWASLTSSAYAERCRNISRGKRAAMNHRLVSVRAVGEAPTFDIQTSTRNFALAAGVFVHNCYEGGAVACGKCGSCSERLEAFAEAGVKDPIPYAAS